MNGLKLKQLKKLYSVYSPLKTNNQLFNHYSSISNDFDQNVDSIRLKYNKEILQGFWNEAVIKSSFVEKFSMKLSPKKTVTIFELNSVNSRADICMINGHSVVYEIKTEFDTFYRLDKQINDYTLLFDFLNIIIPITSLDIAIETVEPYIGIITYRRSRLNTVIFDVYRDPIHNLNTSPKSQLDQLTKSDLKKLDISSEENSKQIIIEEILSLRTSEEINKIFKNILKSKYRNQWEFLLDNKDLVLPLDYQWFFKNNLSTKIIYK